MLRALLMTVLVLFVACGTGDTTSGSAAHRHFAAVEPLPGAQSSVLYLRPYALMEGRLTGGIMHVGPVDYSPLDNRGLMVETLNMRSPLIVEAQLSPDDSLTLLVRFSYAVQDDSVCEIVSGTLHVPLEDGSAMFYHKLPMLPFYDASPEEADSGRFIPSLDFLPI